MALIVTTDEPYKRDFYHWVLRGHSEGIEIRIDKGFEWKVEGGEIKSISVGYQTDPIWYELGNKPDYLSSRKIYYYRAWQTYYVNDELVKAYGALVQFTSINPTCTGFTNFDAKRMMKKYYSYHGVIMKCNIQPNPKTFICEDTKEAELTGPYHLFEVKGTFVKCVELMYERYNPDKHVENEEDYLIARNALAANQALPIPPAYKTQLIVGQYVEATWKATIYRVYRITLEFENYLNIGEGAPVQNVTLQFRLYLNWAEHEFDIIIQNGQPTYPHDPPVVEDYFYEHYKDNGGSMNTIDMVGGHNYYIKFNSLGKSWVKIGSPGSLIAKICLRSSNDINAVRPWLWYGWGDEREVLLQNTTYPVRLNIGIHLIIPTVTTITPVNIEKTSAWLYGKMINNGWWVDKYGFEWKKGIEGSISHIDFFGNIQSGTTFYKIKTGLTPDTEYYYKAWGLNGAGEGKGNWVLVKTLAE